jgi:uncharacterized membrane protein YdbT with pleckstrin-like domain
MNIDTYLSKQLQPGEDLVRIVRPHRATMFPTVGGGAVFILLDFFLVAWWFQHHGWGGYGFALMLLIGLWLIIRGVYLWRHNVLAITTRRVIDVDQRGIFERHVAETTFDKIQDVRYVIRGLWPTMFRYGTIIIQTAGATTNVELEAVHHPVEVQQLILDLQRNAEHG